MLITQDLAQSRHSLVGSSSDHEDDGFLATEQRCRKWYLVGKEEGDLIRKGTLVLHLGD